MKKWLVLFLILCCVLFLVEWERLDYACDKQQAIPPDYEKAAELARIEFLEVFKDQENIQIDSTAIYGRIDGRVHAVIRIGYTSDHGQGSYGFEYKQDENENWYVVRQGEDITESVIGFGPD